MKLSKISLPVKAAAVALFIPATAPAEDLPVYRGVDRDGIYEGEIRTDWDATPPAVLWRKNVGLGYSSNVISEGLLYTIGHDGKETDTVYCLNPETGEEVWKHSYPQPLGDHYYQGGSTGVPTVDPATGTVFSLARDGKLFAFDVKTGEIKWNVVMTDAPYSQELPEWGFAGAPIVYRDLLLLNVGEAGVAVNASDGSLAWNSDDEMAGYSTPYVFQKGDRDLAIFTNKKNYVCVDPKTGEELWSERWMTRYGVNAADPIVSGDLVFISTGYEKGATLLRWTGPYQEEPETAWKSRDMRTQMNPATLVDGHLYAIDGNERTDLTGLTCIEMETGAVKWREPAFGHGANLVADNHLITISEDGKLTIAPLSPDAYNPTIAPADGIQVVKERVWTAPVIANGLLYVRGEKGELVCLDVRK